jgi:hypothetical protein
LSDLISVKDGFFRCFFRKVASHSSLTFLLSLALWLCVASEVWSAAPTLTNVFPAGGQRGTKVVVTCTGAFTWPVKVWSPGIDAIPTNESGKLEITIPNDLAADRVWIRLYDAEGASSTFPFLIGGQKEINEVEPNNKPREAQVIAEPDITVNGTLKDAEVDCFAVTLMAGQTLVAAVDANTRLGSPMDSILQIVSPEGIVLAENHDDLKLDPRLPFTVTRTGPYIVRLFAFPAAPDTSIRFNGGANHIYRLTLTTGPYVTHAVPLSVPLVNPGSVSVAGWNLAPDRKLNVVPFGGTRLADYQEFEVLDELRRSTDARIGFAFAPDSSLATRVRLTPQAVINNSSTNDPKTPLAIPLSSSVTGCLKSRHQADDYLIPLLKGQQIVISAESRSLDLPLDPVMKFADPSGAVIADIDDTGPTRDSSITHAATKDGDYRLTVSDRFRQGGERCWYLLTARLDQPDFELSVTSDSIVVAPDKPTELTVKVQRRGSAAEVVGAITIEATGLPEGLTSSVAVSEITGPTAGEVKLMLSSTGMTAFSGPVRVIGKTTQPKSIERFARTPAKLGASFETIWLTAIKSPPAPASNQQ